MENYATSAPAAAPDELEALGADDGTSEVRSAIDVCATVQGWYEQAPGEVGTYLRRHPEMGTQRLTPPLVRLMGSEDPDLRKASCRALFAMGDRSADLRKSIQEIYEFETDPANFPLTEWASPGFMRFLRSPDPDTWEALLKQFDGSQASTQAAPQEDDVPLYQGNSPPADPVLPPGAVFALGETRFRHGREISCLDFSADGRTLLTAGGDLVCLWNVADGRLKSRLLYPVPATGDPSEATYIYDVAFLPDNRVLLLCGFGSGGRLKVWGGGPETPAAVGPPGKKYWRLLVSPDGKTLAADDNDAPAVQLFELPSCKPLRRLTWTQTRKGGCACVGMAFSPGGKTLVYCYDYPKHVLVFNVPEGNLLHDWAVKAPPAGLTTNVATKAADLIPSGMAVDKWNHAILLDNGGTTVLDLATGKAQFLDKKAPLGDSLQADGRVIAAPGKDGMDLFLAEDHRKLLTAPLEPGCIVLRDAKMAAWSRDGGAILWNLAENKPHLFSSPRRTKLVTILDATDAILYGSAADKPPSVQGSVSVGELAAAQAPTYDEYGRPNKEPPPSELQVWDVAGRRLQPSPLKLAAGERVVAVSFYGNRIATVRKGDPALSLYDLSSGELVARPGMTVADPKRAWPPEEVTLSGSLACLGGDPPALWTWDLDGKLLDFVTIQQRCVWWSEKSPCQSLRPAPIPCRACEPLLAQHGLTFLYSDAREVSVNNPLVSVGAVACPSDPDFLATSEGDKVSIWRIFCPSGDGPEVANIVRQFRVKHARVAWIDKEFLLVEAVLDQAVAGVPDLGGGRQCHLDIYSVATCKRVGRLGGVYWPIVSTYTFSDVLYTSHADGMIYAWYPCEIDQWCSRICRKGGPPPPTTATSPATQGKPQGSPQ